MPVKVRKRRGKYRIVEESNSRIAKTNSGKARDGGGHRSKTKAQAQARAINASIRRKKKK